MSAGPRLELCGISKGYPGVKANDHVDLRVMPGEIHAVLGENGAGKSTLMKIIYGAVHPDAGEIRWNGLPVRITSPRQARALGIAMVFQHFALFDTMTVAENVWLGLDDTFSRRDLDARIGALVRAHDLDTDPERFATRRVSELSVGERQRVEILRALLTDPRLLILDEPTSVLTPQAAETLFATLRRLAAGGCSILYISHKLDEVRALCTRCTVMRAGRITGVVDPRLETNQSLSERMLGAAAPALWPADDLVREAADAGAPPARKAAPALEVRALSRRAPTGVALDDIALTLRAGEILGVAGISGSGQDELANVLSGEERHGVRGQILLAGREVSAAPPRARRALGLRSIPAERIGRGAVPSLSLATNTLLTRREPIARAGILRWGAARRLAARLIERFAVRARGPDDAAASLSGGNLQKFIVGREIDAQPSVLLVAQPTWGLDVGAATQIRRDLRRLAARGVALLVVSEDLEELFELADDLVVMARGRLSPRVPVRATSVAQIGLWMSGLYPGGPASATGGPSPASADAPPGELEEVPARG
ncbi:MAG TPA: ABC transporter ATP-binding protein [Polyangia bacterium]|nr:ABC transporter ATP-binding protein [Polyangia bacterium]